MLLFLRFFQLKIYVIWKFLLFFFNISLSNTKSYSFKGYQPGQKQNFFLSSCYSYFQYIWDAKRYDNDTFIKIKVLKYLLQLLQNKPRNAKDISFSKVSAGKNMKIFKFVFYTWNCTRNIFKCIIINTNCIR